MSQEREREIRLQFLEEATDYLDIIESALLELATSKINGQMDAVLRAAHSIKGGAAMMGFTTLSDIAHRMEDFFKILKNQKLPLETTVQSLLLAGVDCLRQVVALNRQGKVIEQQWLKSEVNPVFEQLEPFLGEVQEDTAPTSGENEPDMLALIFETEVEEYLQRLEQMLAEAKNPQLLAEISTMAQDLSSVGEMLQVDAFKNLCESVIQQLEATPERVEKIAVLALSAWRRSQAALLVGQIDTLPTEIDLEADLDNQLEAIDPMWESLLEQISADDIFSNKVEDQLVELGSTEAKTESKSNELKSVQISVLSEPNLEFALATETQENQENTVRVAIKQLERLNDLFGELTIERHGLDIHLKRLRNLVRTLALRVKTIEQSYGNLKAAYDKSVSAANTLPSITQLQPEIEFDEEWELSDKDTGSSKVNNIEINQDSDLEILSEEVARNIVQLQEMKEDIDLGLTDTDQTVSELNRTTKQLQICITQLRMRPLSDLLGRFKRALRELGLQYGKNVELKVQGDGTLVDRTILEALGDPLMHLLRNAFAHGIEDPATRQAKGKPEVGVISIKAACQGNRTVISISDDGGGIDLDKIQRQALNWGLNAQAIASMSEEKLLSLIFEPSFSTAGEITDLSGRGVGLDVVRTNLRKIRGEIKVDTQPDVGTTFTLSVPLTLSVARVLLVESNAMVLAFPSDAIAAVTVLNPEADQPGDKPICLGEWLKLRCSHKTADFDAVPVMNVPTVLAIAPSGAIGAIPQDNKTLALQVDRYWGEQEVAIRQVEGTIPMPTGFNGCAILGDGRVVPLVNTSELLDWIISCQQQSNLQPALSQTTTTHQIQRNTILVVDDSINVRRFLSLTLEKAGYRVEQAHDGQDGLEKLLSGLPVSAVISDIDMPRLDGYGLLAHVKSKPIFKQLPIVMLTSRSGQKERQLAMSLGATAYFAKPCNEQELLQTLKHLLHH